MAKLESHLILHEHGMLLMLLDNPLKVTGPRCRALKLVLLLLHLLEQGIVSEQSLVKLLG